jgi:hypothetical protein
MVLSIDNSNSLINTILRKKVLVTDKGNVRCFMFNNEINICGIHEELLSTLADLEYFLKKIDTLISCEGMHLKNVPANFKNPRYVINPDLKSLRHVSCPFFLPTNTVGMQSICSLCQRGRKEVSNFKINEKKRLNRSTRSQLALKNSRIVQKRARRLKLKNKEIIQELKEVRKKK